MLFLVALVVTQVPHQFQHVQLTHHQETPPVLHHAVLILLTELVKFSMELVDLSTGQGHALGQTAQPTQKQTLRFAVRHFVELGAPGLTVQEVVLEPGLVRDQTARPILKQKLSAT